MNSIRGSGSLSRNLAVTLSAVSVQGQTPAETKTLVKIDSQGVGAHGYDPVDFVMEGKAIKGKFRQILTAEAFIERRTNGENNWTIGYCSDDASAIEILGLFCSTLICVYMSQTCQQDVNKLLAGRCNS